MKQSSAETQANLDPQAHGASAPDGRGALSALFLHANDAIPVAGGVSSVLSNLHGQEILRTIICRHAVQITPCFAPVTFDKVLQPRFEIGKILIRQLRHGFL